MKNVKQPARLEDWFVGPHDMLIGKCYGHPKHSDGHEIITSRVVKFDKENNKAYTKNREYVLGKPLTKGDNNGI